MSRTLPVLLGLLALLPAGTRAQAQESGDEGPRVGGYVEPIVGWTSLEKRSVFLLGAGAGLLLGERISLGGRAMRSSGAVTLGDGAGDRSLGFGYGGLFILYSHRMGRGVTVGVGGTLGAGRADVRDPTLNVELGSDNFVVLEPELHVGYRPAPPVRVGLAVGYRHAASVQDLPGVAPSVLRSPTASLSVRLVRAP